MRKRAIWLAVIVHSLALLSCQFPPSSNDFQYYQCTITSFIDAYKLKFPDRFWGTWASGIPHSYGETWVLSASNGVQTEDASGNVLENWQDEISKILLGYSLKRIEITIDGNTATLVFTSDCNGPQKLDRAISLWITCFCPQGVRYETTTVRRGFQSACSS